MNRFHGGGFFAGGFFGTDGGAGSGMYRWTSDEISQYVDGLTPEKKKRQPYEYPNYLDRYWKK